MWPQLQPKTWSEAVLKMYKGANYFIIDSLQKCILEAAIDRLDIQLGTISPFNPDWIARQSMTAFKMQFWRLSMIKWFTQLCTLLYILRMASNHVLGCSWGHTWLIWMKFSENVGIIPIKICNFLQFLFSWTHEPQIQIQIVWKLCCHPVGFIQQLRGQNFPFFDPLPPHFVQVVIECPLSIGRLLTVSFFWHY